MYQKYVMWKLQHSCLEMQIFLVNQFWVNQMTEKYLQKFFWIFLNHFYVYNDLKIVNINSF
jgi:hypothetical protein